MRLAKPTHILLRSPRGLRNTLTEDRSPCNMHRNSVIPSIQIIPKPATRTHTPTIEEIASCNPGTTYRPLPEVLFPDIVRLMRGMPERRVLRQTRYFVSSETRPEDNGRRRRSHKSLSSSTREEPLNAFRGSLGCACRATPVCPRPPSPARVPTAAPKHNTPPPPASLPPSHRPQTPSNSQNRLTAI